MIDIMALLGISIPFCMDMENEGMDVAQMEKKNGKVVLPYTWQSMKIW